MSISLLKSAKAFGSSSCLSSFCQKEFEILHFLQIRKITKWFAKNEPPHLFVSLLSSLELSYLYGYIESSAFSLPHTTERTTSYFRAPLNFIPLDFWMIVESCGFLGKTEKIFVMMMFERKKKLVPN